MSKLINAHGVAVGLGSSIRPSPMSPLGVKAFRSEARIEAEMQIDTFKAT